MVNGNNTQPGTFYFGEHSVGVHYKEETTFPFKKNQTLLNKIIL